MTDVVLMLLVPATVLLALAIDLAALVAWVQGRWR
jgi:hypothetical protein